MVSILYFRNFRQLANLFCACNFCHKNKLHSITRIGYYSTQNNSEEPDSVPNIIPEIPEEPTTCCMSGCANCVWLDYADKLSAYMCDNGGKAKQIIEEHVSDPNVKAFLLHELRMRQKSN